MTNPALCSECAAQRNTCCRGSQVFLTYGDVLRIKAGGHGDFAVHELPGMDEAESNAAHDPLWRRTFSHPDGRRVLRRTVEEDCVFLQSDGCILPMDVRPLVCRLYPLEYTPDAITGINAHRCPDEARSNPPLLLALLGMRRDEAEQWRRALYREIREEYGE